MSQNVTLEPKWLRIILIYIYIYIYVTNETSATLIQSSVKTRGYAGDREHSGLPATRQTHLSTQCPYPRKRACRYVYTDMYTYKSIDVRSTAADPYKVGAKRNLLFELLSRCIGYIGHHTSIYSIF